jgi:hypothetical protein
LIWNDLFLIKQYKLIISVKGVDINKSSDLVFRICPWKKTKQDLLSMLFPCTQNFSHAKKMRTPLVPLVPLVPLAFAQEQKEELCPRRTKLPLFLHKRKLRKSSAYSSYKREVKGRRKALCPRRTKLLRKQKGSKTFAYAKVTQKFFEMVCDSAFL